MPIKSDSCQIEFHFVILLTSKNDEKVLILVLKTVLDGLIDFNAKDSHGSTQILILMLKTVMDGLKY